MSSDTGEDVPADRCGFTLSPADLVEAYEDGTDEWYAAGPGMVTCIREPWNDAGRCLWHAETAEKPVEALQATRADEPERLDGACLAGVDFGDAISFAGCILFGADLSSADLRGADLTDADLWWADLGDADLWRADLGDADLRWAGLSDADLRGADLTDADLRGTDLADAILWDAELTDADLPGADLTDADLRGADLGDADLEEATIERTDLFDATLTRTALYGADLDGMSINRYTEFGGHYDADDRGRLQRLRTAPRRIWRGLVRASPRVGQPDADDIEADREDLRKAAWSYRQVANLSKEHGFGRQARRLNLRRKEARRRLYLLNEPERRSVWRWAKATVSSATTRYGESYWRVIGFSGLVVAVWTLAYYALGTIRIPQGSPEAQRIGLELVEPVSLSPTAREVLLSLYFSVVTFTNLGYGDLQPVGWAQTLASVESFAGALLMALLVFVLGRRTTW